MRATRPLSTLVMLAAALGVCLSITTAAFAADGVRVLPSAVATPDPGQLDPAISGDYLAYVSTNPDAHLSDQSSIALKYLGDESRPYIIPTPDYPPVGTPDYKDMQPSIAVDGSKIYVVWTRGRLAEPWDGHIWIWKGEYRTPLTGGPTAFIADQGYPKILVEGPDHCPLPSQDSPSIGLARRGAEQHVIVAWEDSRDTAPQTPEVFWHDLTEAPDPAPNEVGLPVDPIGVLGRGQHLPTVGSDAIFWLDERFSWWDDGNLTDTAVYRMDLATLTPAYYFRDTHHGFDNGSEEPVQATWNGAVWLRLGPYAGAGALPYVKPAGSPGRTLVPLIRPFDLSTAGKSGTATTGMAVAAMHADRIDAMDADIFFFDVATGVRVPVCDRGNPAGATPGTNPDYFTYHAMSPEIGPAPHAYRVVWADQRASAAEDSTDAKLYEAFVPTVSWRLRQTSIRNLTSLRATVAVQPDFAGQPVKLQRVTPVKWLGGTYYRPAGRGYLATATMTAGAPDNGSSVATFKWTPKTKGTYYVRVWFPGASKYTYDGMTVAGPGVTAVPHVGNSSKVVKVTVK